MALNFDNEIPEWKNEGVEPSEELMEKGFTGGYKPPATVFNWFWCKVQKCISELQSKFKSHFETIQTELDDKLSKSNGGTIDNPVHFNENVYINKKHIYSEDKKIDIDFASENSTTLEFRVNGELFRFGEGFYFNSKNSGAGFQFYTPLGSIILSENGKLSFLPLDNLVLKYDGTGDRYVGISENFSINGIPLKTSEIVGFGSADDKKSVLRNFFKVNADNINAAKNITEGGINLEDKYALKANTIAMCEYNCINAYGVIEICSERDIIKGEKFWVSLPVLKQDSGLYITVMINNMSGTVDTYKLENSVGTQLIKTAKAAYLLEVGDNENVIVRDTFISLPDKDNQTVNADGTYSDLPDVDTSPASESKNLITSGGVYTGLEALRNKINLQGNFYVGSCTTFTMVDADVHLTISLSSSDISISNRDLMLIYFNIIGWTDGNDLITGVTIRDKYYPLTSRANKSFTQSDFPLPCMLLITIFGDTAYLVN